MAQPLAQFKMSPQYTGPGTGTGNAELDRQAALRSVRMAITTWPRMNEALDEEARTALNRAYNDRSLGRPIAAATDRFMQTVKARFQQNAESEINTGNLQFWRGAAARTTTAQLPELARVFANTVQLVTMGGGDQETRNAVGGIAFPRPPATRNTGNDEQTPGRSLAEAIAEATRGRVIDTYREPVVVQVEDNEGNVETLPPVAPCELDEWQIDLRGWYWLTKMYQQGTWG